MIVETRDLRKCFRDVVALDGVDLAVPDGGVYGLVGPNGAGKSTLLGILSGLQRQTSGEVRIAVGRERVATLIDVPEFEPWLSAREVVDLARTLTAPHLPTSSVDDALGEVGLADAAGRRVGGFSRGMLQRLGLAATFVGEPALLLLDEPASALDPEGRRDVLDLVRRLARRATVVFSSHILADVQRVAETVGILRDGRLLHQGPIDQLLQGALGPAWDVRIRGSARALLTVLEAAPWVRSVELTDDETVRVRAQSMEEGELELPGAIAASGVALVSVVPAAADLERVFLELTA